MMGGLGEVDKALIVAFAVVIAIAFCLDSASTRLCMWPRIPVTA